jgi:hypothetical protein
VKEAGGRGQGQEVKVLLLLAFTLLSCPSISDYTYLDFYKLLAEVG